MTGLMKLFACRTLQTTCLVIVVLAMLLLILTACSRPTLTPALQSAAEVESAPPDEPVQVDMPDEASATFTTAPSKTPTQTEEPPTITATKTTPVETATPRISRTPRPSMTASPIARDNLAAPAGNEWLPDPSASDPPPIYFYDCEILDQQPVGFTEFEAGAHFDLVWEVRNIGSSQWEKDQYFFKYLSGTHFEKSDNRFEFDHLVGPGNQIKFVVDFIAPKDPGVYETYWGIVNMDTNEIACDLYFAVKVK